jgi:hypothetical protein
MKNNNKKNNLLLDFLILTGFLLSFFLKLTGLAIHQWMGVALFLLTLIHLVNHWTWVINVAGHFFGKMKPRLKTYAVMDGLLLIGFAMICLTGLVISTWFNLNIGNYTTWLNLHIYFSIGTLILTVIKIGMHWRWILITANKIFKKSPAISEPVPSSGLTATLSRRQFLVMMGVVSLGSALAISNVLPKRKSIQSTSSTENKKEVTISEGEIAEQQPTSNQGQSESTSPIAQSTTNPQNTPTAVPQATSQPALVCNGSCRKGNHCAYPGRCHEYRDTNNNGLCDLGECS